MALDVGLVMVMEGTVVSKVMESLAVFDTFPAASLYQIYTILLPSPLLKVYETLAL